VLSALITGFVFLFVVNDVLASMLINSAENFFAELARPN
jgi:hypothetical protein